MTTPDDPLDFLPQIGRQPLPYFSDGPYQPAEVPLTGVSKHIGQVARGASMGFLGDPRPPETIPQHISEMVGMAIPAIGSMAVATPMVGATPLLRTFPILAQRAIAGGLSGAATSGMHAKNTGGDVTTEALIGGALGAVGEVGWAAWAKRARGRSPAEVTDQNINAYSRGAAPTVPSVGPDDLQPTPIPHTPPRPEIELGAGTAVEAPAPKMEMELGPGGGYGEIPYSPLLEQAPLTSPPVPGRFGLGSAVYDTGGATQLDLPVTVAATGRAGRYAAPTRYKGTFPTSQLASLESDLTAAKAIQEGAQTVRVTTTIQPPGGGPPTGGIVRVYKAGPEGPELVSEQALNMGAVRAAQAGGASPMRRVVHDYFDVQYNEKLGEDILIPKFPQVEDGLQMALSVDPRAHSIPLTPQQVAYIQSVGGRALRQELDIAAKIPQLDDVLKMDEAAARKAFLETLDAPPLMAGAVLKPSDEALRARVLMTQLRISEDEAQVFANSLKDLPETARMGRVMEWLRAKCVGA